MHSDHVLRELLLRREPTPDEIEAAMRRARLERSQVAHELLRQAGTRIAEWFRPRRARAAGAPCVSGA